MPWCSRCGPWNDQGDTCPRCGAAPGFAPKDETERNMEKSAEDWDAMRNPLDILPLPTPGFKVLYGGASANEAVMETLHDLWDRQLHPVTGDQLPPERYIPERKQKKQPPMRVLC